MKVYTINNPEDYSEYRADKMLHDAYQNRVNVPTVDQLVRMWVEHWRTEDVMKAMDHKETPNDRS